MTFTRRFRVCAVVLYRMMASEKRVVVRDLKQKLGDLLIFKGNKSAGDSQINSGSVGK